MRKELVRRRNVIPGLIPKVRKPQQRRMEKEDRGEYQREDVDVAKPGKL